MCEHVPGYMSSAALFLKVSSLSVEWVLCLSHISPGWVGNTEATPDTPTGRVKCRRLGLSWLVAELRRKGQRVGWTLTLAICSAGGSVPSSLDLMPFLGRPNPGLCKKGV